jgi:hypothetical protein
VAILLVNSRSAKAVKTLIDVKDESKGLECLDRFKLNRLKRS